MNLLKKTVLFIKDTRKEWFKIIWPERSVVVRSVIMIFVVSAGFTLFFFITDGILNKLVGLIF